jgi:hypothetical protein
MTIDFTAMDGGETELVLDEVELFADSTNAYLPIETTGARIEVVGNCASFATATPYPVSPSVPQPTAIAPESPDYVAVLPSAAIAATLGCPTSLGAEFAALSLCLEDGWGISTRPSAGNFDEAVVLINESSGVFVGISIVEDTPMSRGSVQGIEVFCDVLESATGSRFVAESIFLRNMEVTACVGQGEVGELGSDPIYAFAPMSNGRFLQIEVTRTAGDEEAATAVERLLSGLQVR